MDAFASALRLPDGALPPAGLKRSSDDVFIRLMGLHKGRKMLARTIRQEARLYSTSLQRAVTCSLLTFPNIQKMSAGKIKIQP